MLILYDFNVVANSDATFIFECESANNAVGILPARGIFLANSADPVCLFAYYGS